MKEDIKSVFMGKPGLENREDFMVQKTCWLSWTIRSSLHGTESLVIATNFSQKWEIFQCDLGGGKETSWSFWTIKTLMQEKSH